MQIRLIKDVELHDWEAPPANQLFEIVSFGYLGFNSLEVNLYDQNQ